jgi:hypothetical protein
MKLIGSYKLKAKKKIVWESLNDANILKQCIPGCESFNKESNTVFTATATNQIGPMNAPFSGTITLSNIQENKSYTISGKGQSSIGFADGSADVKLVEDNGIITLNYEVNVNVGGKIAQLGSRLISGVTQKMADYFFGRFADIVSPVFKEEKNSGRVVKEERVKELKSNFLNKYIYSIVMILVLVLVVIFYFVSR